MPEFGLQYITSYKSVQLVWVQDYDWQESPLCIPYVFMPGTLYGAMSLSLSFSLWAGERALSKSSHSTPFTLICDSTDSHTKNLHWVLPATNHVHSSDIFKTKEVLIW